jgi:proline iminopeptidase
MPKLIPICGRPPRARLSPDSVRLRRAGGSRIPTLVITGRYDMNVAPLTAWRMAHAIPGAKIVFFEKSGHLPAYEEPDRYLQVLESFLSAAH